MKHAARQVEPRESGFDADGYAARRSDEARGLNLPRTFVTRATGPL